MSLRWIRITLQGLAIASGLCATALLALPLLLVLLMILFDSATQAILVLLGLATRWLQALVPGTGGGLPPYRALLVDPAGVALAALARSAPCIAGLVLIVLRGGEASAWRWVLLLWGGAALAGGAVVALTLLPGLAASVLLALPRPSPAPAP